MSKVFVNKLSDHGYPTHCKYYKTSHEEADKAEKKKFPKGYETLKKDERHLSKHELMGKHEKSGAIKVEKKFKAHAKEIEYHERQEHKNLKRLSKK